MADKVEKRILTLYSDVQATSVHWLWYPFIAVGKITLLQGDPGDGKSTMMMNLIAELSKGGKTPDGKPVGTPQRVIYQCSEDGVSDTIKPRLERCGADCRKVAFINEETYSGLTLDDERIRQAIIEFRPRLVVIDPIQAYLGSDSDLQIAGRARKLMQRLGMWASVYDCAIVLIGHLNKKEGTKGLYRSLGSIDVVAAARSVLQVERDQKDTDLRDPAIVIRKDSITFNTACITGLEDVVYVHVMFNNDLKRIVVRGCDENDKDALRWCVAKPDKRKSRKMSCKPFATLVYQKMGWDSECRYKMLGYRITFEGETLYVFDLLVPEIFHEGQRKKNAVDSQDNAASTKPVNSRKGFYLDDIVGTFGVPVEEHRKESEVKQMDGYVSMGILTGKIAPEAGKD